MWTQEQAIALCREIGKFSAEFGGNVALAGGCLHKDGSRKDCDIVIFGDTRYSLSLVKFWECANSIGLVQTSDQRLWGWHATYQGKRVDCTFPNL